jgi:ribosome maturation factor RimP
VVFKLELDKKRTGIESKFYEISKSTTEENGFVLYDMEYISGSSTLRVFIMNKETKTADIDECVKVTRAMNPFFEEEEGNWIPEDIVLEVSSPGMYRSLKTKEHFDLALSQRVQIFITGKLEDDLTSEATKAIQKANSFIGILNEVNEQNIILEIDGLSLPITFEQMKKANLEPKV